MPRCSTGSPSWKDVVCVMWFSFRVEESTPAGARLTSEWVVRSPRVRADPLLDERCERRRGQATVGERGDRSPARGLARDDRRPLHREHAGSGGGGRRAVRVRAPLEGAQGASIATAGG